MVCKFIERLWNYGIEPQKYCDEYAVKFDALKQALIYYTHLFERLISIIKSSSRILEIM